MARFDSLPQEIYVEILAHLDPRSLLRSASTCKSLYQAWKESLELQYTIELAMDGMYDAGTQAAHLELLSRLRDLRSAWDALRWKRVTKVPIDYDRTAYELAAGVFAISDGHGLKVIWLPSATTDGCIVEHKSMGIPIGGLTIDPTQDLVIILEVGDLPIFTHLARHFRVHLKTVSTNQYHPLAGQAVFAFHMSPDPKHGNALRKLTVQVAYDIVAVFIAKGGRSFKLSRVLIWNWHEGVLVYDSEQSTSLRPDISDFSLLSRTSFVLTSTRAAGILLLYTFSPHTPAHLTSPSISSSSSISSSDSPPTYQPHLHLPLPPPSLSAALHLPPICLTHRISEVDLEFGPIHAHPPENACFSTSPESRVLVVKVWYGTATPTSAAGDTTDAPYSGPRVYSLFVHDRTLLGYISRSRTLGCTNDPQVDGDVNVEWGKWGEMNTRFMASPVSYWPRYVHGQRVICDPDGSDIIAILDFNLANFNRTASSPSSSTSSPTASILLFPQSHPSSTTTSPLSSRQRPIHDHSQKENQYQGRLFQYDIITRLPFRVSTRTDMGAGKSLYTFMIDQERLIGLKREGGGMELHVYSF